MTPKAKKAAVLGLGVFALALTAWLFMRMKGSAIIGTDVSASPVPASAPNPGDNIYAINFPATQPQSIGGTNIALGGTTIGNNCGCCDSGSNLTSDAVTQNLNGYVASNDVLLSMLANLPPTAQSDLGNAFSGVF